jgi:hypothetical protein
MTSESTGVRQRGAGVSVMTIKLTKRIGMLLLGIWLILEGLIPLLNISFSGLGTVMALLVITAGVFILVER